MKKDSFFGGALVATLGIIIVKIIGVIYVIPFNALIGTKGGALYGYGYNVYALFLSASSAGFPFAVSKLTSEYLALDDKKTVSRIYKISRNIIFILSVIMFLLLFGLATPIAKLIAVSGTGGNTVEDIAFILRVVSFAILIIPFLSVTRGFLQGHKIIAPGSISQIIEQLVRVVVILLGCYLALKVFNIGLTNAVAISVFAAFIGGVCALSYLQFKLHHSRLLSKSKKEDLKIDYKVVVKRLCMYAIPYVIISIVCNLYETTDMIIVQRMMSDVLHINVTTTEAVSSVFTIWGGKFNSIILALIIGLTTSLTPNIVSSFTKGDIKDVSSKINKSLEYILFLILPLTVFISVFAKQLWTMFYGVSNIGPSVYKYFVFYALFGGMFTVLVNVLQSLSKYKEVVISILIGLLFNLVFDAPFVLLFSKIGLVPAGGAVCCGVIGYSISISYALWILNNRYKISTKDTLKKLKRYIPSWIFFALVLFIIRGLVPNNLNGRLSQMIVLVIAGVICFGSYFILSYCNGNLKKSTIHTIKNRFIK